MLAGALAGAALSGEGSPLESVREPSCPGGGLTAQTRRRGGCSELRVQGKAPGQRGGQMCMRGAGGSTAKDHGREVSQALLRVCLFWVFLTFACCLFCSLFDHSWKMRHSCHCLKPKP